ncbi:transcription factor TFIIIB component, partial [Trifolium pratense]
SNGDFLHEADANNEDEFYGSDDGYRDPYDDQYQASENITSTAPLLNYQSFMDKTPRAKWSKQETELFYVAVSFSTDFAMIQQNFFPNKTRRQVKLKFKKEERQNPLQLADALNNHATDLSKFKSLAEKLGQTSNKAEQDTARDAPDFMPGEEVEELTPETNEEVAATQQEQDHINVKDQEDSVAYPVPGQSDDDDDDDDDGGEHQLLDWSQYQSSI